MKTSEEVKQVVKETYTEIANNSKDQNQTSCCGSGCCSTEVYSIMSDDYSELEGYKPEADLGLGCGLPTQYAKIKSGDVVVDLGSGAGNDAFIARQETGPGGKVIGIDMTDAMVEKARQNAENLNFNNVEFRLGEIEKLPLNNETADVVISNCVLNLVPDKIKAFSELYRILKPGGHFSISDIVLSGSFPPNLMNAAEMYAGCVSGAMQKEDYIDLIRKAGFEKLIIQKEKLINIPKDILSNYLSPEEIQQFTTSKAAILSITIYGEKIAEQCCNENCCS